MHFYFQLVDSFEIVTIELYFLLTLRRTNIFIVNRSAQNCYFVLFVIYCF